MKKEPSLVLTSSHSQRRKNKKKKTLKQELFTDETPIKRPLCDPVGISGKRVKRELEAALSSLISTQISQNCGTPFPQPRQSNASFKTRKASIRSSTMKKEPISIGRHPYHEKDPKVSTKDEKQILSTGMSQSTESNMQERDATAPNSTNLRLHSYYIRNEKCSAQSKEKEEPGSSSSNIVDFMMALDPKVPFSSPHSPAVEMDTKYMPTLAPGPVVKPESSSDILIKCEVKPVTVPLQSSRTSSAIATTFQPVPSSSFSDDIDGSKKLCFKYGMVIVERNRETQKAEWIACKFCAVFGCKTRRRNYIMVQVKPFAENKLESHLQQEHETIWINYVKADDLGKSKIFEGTKLPKKEVFDIRVLEMKKNKGYILTKEEEEKIKEKCRKEHDMRRRLLEKHCEDVKTQEEESAKSLRTFGKCVMDWTGRNEFHTKTLQMPNQQMIVYGDICFKNNAFERLRERNWIKHSRLPCLFLPKEIEDTVLHGVLADSWNSVTKNGLFYHPEVYLLEKEQTGKVQWDKKSRSSSWKEYMFITVLGYLSRGLSTFTVDEILGPMFNMIVPGLFNAEGSVNDVIWRIGNSICAESLRLLRETMKLERNWLLMLTLVPCEAMGESGVELFIPVLFRDVELYFMHLISVRDGENVGDAVISLLRAVCPNWEEKIGGFYSHIPGSDTRRKVVEEKIMRELGKHAKMRSLQKFEKGQTEVQELTVERLCRMSTKSVLKTLSMFIQQYATSCGKKNERSLLRIMQNDHRGIISGRLLKEPPRDKVLENWKKVKFGATRDLAKYLHGLQVIWRQDVKYIEGSCENIKGGFLDRNAAYAKCGIVKDWRCESVVDTVLERTACARNMARMRCMMAKKMSFEMERPTNHPRKMRLHNFEAAHLFDANWSNMKGRSLTSVIEDA